MKLRKLLAIPDCHHPYVDERAWRLLLKVAKAWGPDIIVTLGDFADFYSVSSHDKHPGRVRLLDQEVASVNEALTQLDELGASEKYFVLGNHEDRLERYLQTKAPELFNLVRVRDLFKLGERGWRITPYKRDLRIGKLHITHDVGNAGPQAHTKARQAFQDNVVIGHTHRLAVDYEGNAKGKCHVGAMLGWLGAVESIEYTHRVNALRWQLGYGVGYLEPDGAVHLVPVPIVRYRCQLEGRLYEA